MSRNYRRKTTRRRQDERHLSVRAVRRDIPDTKKLSRAFIGLALARAAQAEAEAQAAAETAARRDEAQEPNHDG